MSLEKWMTTVTLPDFRQMKPHERTDFIWSMLGINQREFAGMIAEFEFETKKKPNAVFISAATLARIHHLIRIKRLMGLVVIPVDEPEGKFIVSQEDPWQWGNLFYQ
jgi:hypothetical protein